MNCHQLVQTHVMVVVPNSLRLQMLQMVCVLANAFACEQVWVNRYVQCGGMLLSTWTAAATITVIMQLYTSSVDGIYYWKPGSTATAGALCMACLRWDHTAVVCTPSRYAMQRAFAAGSCLLLLQAWHVCVELTQQSIVSA